MAQNVVFDIDARTKNFESALDELTAKVKSTAAQMDKAFSTTGNAEKSIKSTSSAVNALHSGLKEISLIAAGNVLADGFEKAFEKIKKVGDEIYNTTSRMQSLEMGMKSLVTSDLVKTGQVKDYTEATARAEAETKKLLGWFKELSLKSPYELVEVMDSFKQNANMGQSVETAKKTTEAILALGAGLGMGRAEMKRFSAALAQTGATGRITAMDLRQFANNGFGMDKMNAIFDKLSEKYGIIIKDHNDFNKAIAEGKITTDDFFTALNSYALENYGNAVDAMASTIEGLRSSLGDIKVSAINDLFLEASKTVSKTLAPYVEYLMKMLTGGDFSRWGEGINNWAKGILEPFQKIGETLENGVLTRAMNSLKDFFSGKSMNLGALTVFLNDIGGAEFADKWISKIKILKGYYDKFLEHKDVIISSLKGIGTALVTAFAINKLTQFIGLLGQLNNPITKITLLGAALGVAWNTNLFNIQERAQGVIGYIQSLVEAFQKDGLSGVLEKIKTDVLGVFDNVKNSVKQKFSEIQNAFQTDGFKGVFDLLVADVQPILQRIWDKLPEGFREKIETIINDVNTFIEPIKNAIQNAFAYFGDLKSVFEEQGIGAAVQKVFTDAFNGIKDIMKDILPENVLTTIEQIWGWIEKIGQAIGGIAIGWGALNLVGMLMDVVDTVSLLYGGITGTMEVGGALGGVLATVGSIGFGSFAGIVGAVALLGTALVEGFSILGQFINFGQLISNVFNTVKDSVQNVIDGIVSNVAPKFKGLLETLAPAGTALAAIITWLGTLVLGAVNGLFRAIDDILAAVIDAVDFVMSILRLPFDIIVSLGAFIIGVVTGDTDKIRWAWEHLVERLEYIWNRFKAFFEDIWNGIKDFFKGIWQTIVSIIDSVDISAGLERLFGKEVAEKFEEIRDKVLGYIDEIKNKWQHMKDILSGDIVMVGDKEVSGKMYNAFDERYGREVTLSRLAAEGDQSLFRQMFIDEKGQIDEHAANEAWGKYYNSGITEESLFEEFSNKLTSSLTNWINSQIKQGTSESAIYANVSKYLNNQYGEGFAEDPYVQSLLTDIYSELGLNTQAVEKNTASTDTNTEAEKGGNRTGGKPESTDVGKETDVLIEFTKKQQELLQKATESISKELQNALSSDKTYNDEAISKLGDVLANAQEDSNVTLESLQKSVENWLFSDSVGVGLDNETEKLVREALNSATDKDTYMAVLGEIVTTLETGTAELVNSANGITTGIEEQKSENVKAFDDILNKHINEANNQQSGWNLSSIFSWKKGTQLDSSIFGEQKGLDKEVTDSINSIGAKLDLLPEIKRLEENDLSQKEFEEAKTTLSNILTEVGFSQKEVDDINKLIQDKNTTQEDLAAIYQSLYDLLNNMEMPKQFYNNDTEAYFKMEMTLRDFISKELPKAILDLKTELSGQSMPHMNNWIETVKHWIDNVNTKSMSDEQYINLMKSAISHSNLPQEIQDAFITAFSADGVSRDFVAQYMSTLISTVEEAGLTAAGGNGKATPTFQSSWSEEFTGAWDDLYSKTLSSHAYQISKDTVGMTEKEIKKYLDDQGWSKEKVYESQAPYHESMNQLMEKLPSVLDSMGINNDTFSNVTVTNFADAKDFIGSFDEFNSLYSDVLTGRETDATKIADKMEAILANMTDDETASILTDILRTSENPEWIEFFMGLLSGNIERFIPLLPNLESIKQQVDEIASKEVTAPEPEFKQGWEDYFTGAFDSMYQEFLSGHTYEIYSNTKDMSESEANEWMKSKGYDQQGYYDSHSEFMGLMETLAPALVSALDAAGLNADTFNNITVSNQDAAEKYVKSFDQFGELLTNVNSEQMTSIDIIASEFETVMANMTGNEEIAHQLAEMLKASDNPAWTKFFMSFFGGEIGELQTLLANQLSEISGKIGKGGGGGGTPTATGNKAETDEWLDKFDKNWETLGNANATAWERANALASNQAILDMVYRDFNDLDAYNYNMGGDSRRWDINDARWNDPQWVAEQRREMTDLMNRGLYDHSGNIYGSSYQNNMNYQLEHNPELNGKAKEAEEKVNGIIDSAVEGLDTIEETVTEKKNVFGDGMLGMMFGDSFTAEDFSGLFSLGMQGIADGLNEDTIGALQNLFNLDIDKDKVDAFASMADAMTTLSGALSAMQSVLNEDSITQMDNLFNSLQNMANAELDEAKITAWQNLGNALTTIANALSTLSAEGGTSILDFSRFGEAKAPENLTTAWSDLSSYLSAVSSALSTINSMITVLDMSQFADTELPKEFLDAWSRLAADVDKVSTGLTLLQGVMDTLFGTGENGGMSQMGGMLGGGGGGTVFNLNGSGEEGEGGMGLFEMLFGTLDVETIEALSGFLTPELLTSMLTFLATPIDTQVIESYIQFGNAMQAVAVALTTIMSALTGGTPGETAEDGAVSSFGEVGEEGVGQALSDGLLAFSKTAEEISPVLEGILLPPLNKIREDFELILTNLQKICVTMMLTFPIAVKVFVGVANSAIDKTDALAGAASSAASEFSALASAIWDAVHALEAWLAMGGGGETVTTESGVTVNVGSKAAKQMQRQGVDLNAGGTPHFQYGTAIVGEHGPELITNNGSRAWQIFSNNTLMDEIAHTRHALNMLSNSAEYVAYNKVLGGTGSSSTTTDNSQNFTNNFGTIVGDDAFKSMVADEVQNMIRHELRMARR